MKLQTLYPSFFSAVLSQENHVIKWARVSHLAVCKHKWDKQLRRFASLYKFHWRSWSIWFNVVGFSVYWGSCQLRLNNGVNFPFFLWAWRVLCFDERLANSRPFVLQTVIKTCLIQRIFENKHKRENENNQHVPKTGQIILAERHVFTKKHF